MVEAGRCQALVLEAVEVGERGMVSVPEERCALASHARKDGCPTYLASVFRVVLEKFPCFGIKLKNLRRVDTLMGYRPSKAFSSSLSTSQSLVHVTSRPAVCSTACAS